MKHLLLVTSDANGRSVSAGIRARLDVTRRIGRFMDVAVSCPLSAHATIACDSDYPAKVQLPDLDSVLGGYLSQQASWGVAWVTTCDTPEDLDQLAKCVRDICNSSRLISQRPIALFLLVSSQRALADSHFDSLRAIHARNGKPVVNTFCLLSRWKSNKADMEWPGEACSSAAAWILASFLAYAQGKPGALDVVWGELPSQRQLGFSSLGVREFPLFSVDSVSSRWAAFWLRDPLKRLVAGKDTDQSARVAGIEKIALRALELEESYREMPTRDAPAIDASLPWRRVAIGEWCDDYVRQCLKDLDRHCEEWAGRVRKAGEALHERLKSHTAEMRDEVQNYEVSTIGESILPSAEADNITSYINGLRNLIGMIKHNDTRQRWLPLGSPFRADREAHILEAVTAFRAQLAKRPLKKLVSFLVMFSLLPCLAGLLLLLVPSVPVLAIIRSLGGLLVFLGLAVCAGAMLVSWHRRRQACRELWQMVNAYFQQVRSEFSKKLETVKRGTETRKRRMCTAFLKQRLQSWERVRQRILDMLKTLSETKTRKDAALDETAAKLAKNTDMHFRSKWRNFVKQLSGGKEPAIAVERHLVKPFRDLARKELLRQGCLHPGMAERVLGDLTLNVDAVPLSVSFRSLPTHVDFVVLCPSVLAGAVSGNPMFRDVSVVGSPSIVDRIVIMTFVSKVRLETLVFED